MRFFRNFVRNEFEEETPPRLSKIEYESGIPFIFSYLFDIFYMEPTGHLRPKSMSRAGSALVFKNLETQAFSLPISFFFLLLFFNKFWGNRQNLNRFQRDISSCCFLEWNDTRRIFTVDVTNLSSCYVFDYSVYTYSNFWYDIVISFRTLVTSLSLYSNSRLVNARLILQDILGENSLLFNLSIYFSKEEEKNTF